MPKDKRKIVALQTARGGSKSIPKKNLLEVNGHPLFAHSVMAATGCQYIKSVWCSTDDDTIKSYSKEYDFNVIDRPPELSGDNDSHLEVIRHGILEIEKQIGKQDIVVLLLGNVSGIDAQSLSDAIDQLGNYDICFSVSKFNMFNPYRAMQIRDEQLETFLPQQEIITNTQANDKNSAGDIYYCNGNFWVMKRDTVFHHNNKLPFQWLGKRIKPFVQDVFLELDAPWQKDYVIASSKNHKGQECIWEQGTRKAHKHAGMKKLYGKDHWDRFLETHDYYFVEFCNCIKPYMKTLGNFNKPEIDKYKKYVAWHGYQEDYNTWFQSCMKSGQILQSFDYTFFGHRKDDMFKRKEFGQACILIEEIYTNGSYNYPCFRWQGPDHLAVHPGNHLNFVKTYLGMPIKGFMSFPKKERSKWIDEIHALCEMQIIKKIKNDQQIKKILGTNQIAAWIQDYHNQLVPSFYPSIPRPTWSGYDQNGHTDWPWNDVTTYHELFEKTRASRIIDSILDGDPITKWAKVKTNYATPTIEINNFCAFLLTNKDKDNNFELI